MQDRGIDIFFNEMLPFSAWLRANKLHNRFKIIVSFLRYYDGVLAPNTRKKPERGQVNESYSHGRLSCTAFGELFEVFFKPRGSILGDLLNRCSVETRYEI